MNRIVRIISVRGFFIVLCACGGQAAMLPTQTLNQTAASANATLSLPDHPSSSQVFGINDAGVIAAHSDDAAGGEAYVGHAPYDRSDFRKIAFPGAVTTTVTALNNDGLDAGFYTDANGNIAAFTERNGAWTHYEGGSKTTEYLGVNDAGTTVGFSTDRRGIKHAFERDTKTGKVLDIRPTGGISVTASAINAAGDVVGYMTTGRGHVDGFYWKDGRFDRISYPGATSTKALGINKNDEIVGAYVDTFGRTHGFVLRRAAAAPQWKSYDAAGARGATVLTGINADGDAVGYYRDEKLQVRGLLADRLSLGSPGGTSVPLVIPVWGQGGDGQDADPGATPDQHLFAVIFDNTCCATSSLAANCPGVSSTSTCQPYKYVDLLYDFCNTQTTLAAYQWADANDEAAFLHVYPNGITKSNRIIYQATPNPSGPDCKPDNQNAVMRMNPGDSAYNAYLYNNVWNGSDKVYDFPSPWGVMEDSALVQAGIIVGGYGEVTTEYGSGTNPSGFANQVGNSQYHDSVDSETGLGEFVNGACSSKCVDVGLNGVATGAGNILACNDISGGHCHVPYYAGVIDNQTMIDNICKTVKGGNLMYFNAERPIFSGRFGIKFMSSQTMTVDINTSANLYSHTSDGCAKTKIVDLETSYGAGGVGDIAGGHIVRLTALAYHWLVPNPATGIPDRVISDQLTEGGTYGEVPYFFEDTLVPVGAEIAVPKFVWNGTVETTGGGCPSASGDKGGAISLLVQCVVSAGIYCQQYASLYIDGTNYGKAAACLNTSLVPENIVSSWFKHDPISSYKYELSLQGGEMTSVPYAGVSGGSIALPSCTNKTYCTGQNTLSSQVSTFKGNGTDVLCGPCGVILLQNN